PVRQLAPVGSVRVPAGACPRLRGRAARRAVGGDRAPPRPRRAGSPGGLAAGRHGGADRQPQRRRAVRAGGDRLRGAGAARTLGGRGWPCGADPSHGRVGLWRAALHTAAQRPVQGFGARTFLAATRERQLKERPVPTRFAHDLPLQVWVEVGLGGLLAVLAWYVAVATTLVRDVAPPRPNPVAWLL